MKFILSSLTLLFCCLIFSQTSTLEKSNFSVNAGGGEALGSTGNFSFSVGQLFFAQTSSKEGYTEEGIQHYHSFAELNVKEKGILVFPNPVQDVLFISLEINDYSNLTYSLFELSGKTIVSGTISSAISKINLDFLTEGVYGLMVLRDNRVINTIKLVKK